MTDLKERLKQHADWLESCGQATTQAHIDPDNATEAAKDIREAINQIEDLEAKPDPGYLDASLTDFWHSPHWHRFK